MCQTLTDNNCHFFLVFKREVRVWPQFVSEIGIESNENETSSWLLTSQSALFNTHVEKYQKCGKLIKIMNLQFYMRGSLSKRKIQLFEWKQSTRAKVNLSLDEDVVGICVAHGYRLNNSQTINGLMYLCTSLAVLSG